LEGRICEDKIIDARGCDMTIRLLLQIALWIWFLGCTTTYKVGKYTLVEGMGIKSAEFIMQCLYSIGLILYYITPSAGKWTLLGILILWFAVQFNCHWYYTIFGGSEKKIKGYNECFRNTVHVIPMSDTRLIPDLYHMIQHTLILLNIIFGLIK
jgi:hypothetical protein